MRRTVKTAKGFSVLELMITLAVLGVLASIAIPFYADSTREARSSACTVNRDTIRKSVLYYIDETELEPGSPLPTLQDMKTAGILIELPTCPSGGSYIWIDEEVMQDITPQIGCSFHYWPSLALPDKEPDETDSLSDSGKKDRKKPPKDKKDREKLPKSKSPRK